MKQVALKYLPGDECWVRGQDRVCIIENVTIGKDQKGAIEYTYIWYNLDAGVDVTEVWNDGYFGPEDIGKTVFDSYEELIKAFPEDFPYENTDEKFRRELYEWLG